MDGIEAQFNFDAPAVLRKWPSLANQRTEDAANRACVRGLLVYCADYRCSHSIEVNADQRPDHVRLSAIKPRFTFFIAPHLGLVPR
jgi:hypothetical protein